MARILVVDDDEFVRLAVSSVIERLGHEVLVAESGVQALEILAAEPIDLIISDVSMPKMDGIELILRVRADHPDLPVLIMSGGGMIDREVLLENDEALGTYETIAKPFEFAEVEAAIARLLGGPGRPLSRG